MEDNSERGKTEFLIQFIKIMAIITVLSIYPYIAAQTEPLQVDRLSLANVSMFDLFYPTLFRIGKKVDGRVVRNAVDLVAREGEWKRILDELDKGNGPPIFAITILGLIAEDNARERANFEFTQRTGYAVQRMGGTNPPQPSPIVPELLKRVRFFENREQDYFVIALARARDPRCKEFFLNILEKPDERGYDQFDLPRFHAAVGLANIHEAAGVEWLIEHSAATDINIRNAWPGRTRGKRLDQCCDQALIQLSGRYGIEDIEYILRRPTKDSKKPPCECVFSRGPNYWRKWWDEAGHQLEPDAQIGLVDWQQ